MKLKDFFQQYGNEEACKLKFKAICDQQGVVCKKCQCKAHYWHKNLWQYQCKQCHFRTTLRSGTVMEGSQLPFRYWLTAMAFLTLTKKSIAALELQRKLGHKRYEPIWAMLHKLRLVMRCRDANYELKEFIELVEGFKKTSDRKAKAASTYKNQQGRGSDRQAPVLVAVASKPVANPQKHQSNRQVKFLKMTVMDGLTSKDINHPIGNTVAPQTLVLTDGYKGYFKLNEVIKAHKVDMVKDKTQVDKMFPWVHKAISNAKRLLLGIHHSVKLAYMQNYLDEYCYKFNRRYREESIFDGLLVAAVATPWHKNMYKCG